MKTREVIEKLSKDCADQGRLIEAGWVSLRYLAIPDDAPAVQVDEMRKAFFAGAQHLFASIMSILEPGAEPSDKDLERMTLIHTELDKFVAQLKTQKWPPNNIR